jgi:hypothetical protein
VDTIGEGELHQNSSASDPRFKRKDPNQTFKTVVRPWVSTLVFSGLVGALIVFLVITEVDFYINKGFHISLAIFFASLFHLCKIALSYAIVKSDWVTNLCLLIPCLVVLVGGIGWINAVSVENVQNKDSLSNLAPVVLEAHKRLKNEYDKAKDKADKIWDEIVLINGKIYWSAKKIRIQEFLSPDGLGGKRDATLAALNSFEEKHRILKSSKENQSETHALIALRWLGIALTIVFSFLATKLAPIRHEEVLYGS